MSGPRMILVVSLLALLVMSACSARLVSRRVGSLPACVNVDNTTLCDKAGGIPWVEPRLYDVYVIRKNELGQIEVLSFSRHALVDRVNGAPLEGHDIWEVNYSAGPFSDASLELEMDANGSLKKATLKSTSAPLSQAADAAKSAVSVEEEIEKQRHAELKRRKEMIEFQKAIDETQGK